MVSAILMDKRTPIGKFIHSSWTNLNIRAGKYRHLQTVNKCKNYENINIEFTRKEYKQWCIENKNVILFLNRPSLNRIDSLKNYSIDNIEVIELTQNIRMKNPGTAFFNGPRSKELRGITKSRSGKKFIAKIQIKNKVTYIGTFQTKEEAYTAFKNEYIKYYGELPW